MREKSERNAAQNYLNPIFQFSIHQLIFRVLQGYVHMPFDAA